MPSSFWPTLSSSNNSKYTLFTAQKLTRDPHPSISCSRVHTLWFCFLDLLNIYSKQSHAAIPIKAADEERVCIRWLKMEMRKWVMMMLVLSLLEGSRGLSLCNMDSDGLEACKPSVSEPNPLDPTPECCKALAGADLDCLCSYKSLPQLPLLGIDPTLAIALPAKCNLTLPSNC